MPRLASFIPSSLSQSQRLRSWFGGENSSRLKIRLKSWSSLAWVKVCTSTFLCFDCLLPADYRPAALRCPESTDFLELWQIITSFQQESPSLSRLLA